MGKYYVATKTSEEYWLPKSDFLAAVHYALRYNDLKDRLETLADTRSIDYSKTRVKSSNDFDSTFDYAEKRAEISKKIKLIDDCIDRAGGDLKHYLKLAVCDGYTFDQLKGKGLPCERTCFYSMRKKFYYLLAQKI